MQGPKRVEAKGEGGLKGTVVNITVNHRTTGFEKRTQGRGTAGGKKGVERKVNKKKEKPYAATVLKFGCLKNPKTEKMDSRHRK